MSQQTEISFPLLQIQTFHTVTQESRTADNLHTGLALKEKKGIHSHFRVEKQSYEQYLWKSYERR